MPAASVPLVDPESSVLWRASFAIAALGGAMALIALRGAAPGKLGLTAYISAIVLLIILVFAGVNVAWLLLFAPAPSEYAAPGRADQLAWRDSAGYDRIPGPGTGVLRDNVTDRRNLAIRCGPASTGS
jgi:hypothetical protein